MAFSKLARDHHRELLIYARALSSDENAARDIVQESLVTAWHGMCKYDSQRDFGAWVRGIVRNKWRELQRSERKYAFVSDEVIEQMESQLQVWQKLKETGSSVFEKLEDCVRALPDTLASAVQAFYYDELDTQSAADELQIAGATLRKRLERARTNLRECLNQ